MGRGITTGDSAVPLSDLIGKARQISFSEGENGIRWSRLGKVVE
jgi:hypothetical protein